MTIIQLNTPLQRQDKDVAETDFEGKVVLLHIEHGKYYNFNPTSSDIWRWLQEPTTPEVIAERLYQKYDCNLDKSQADVMQFLHELQTAQLLIIQ